MNTEQKMRCSIKDYRRGGRSPGCDRVFYLGHEERLEILDSKNLPTEITGLDTDSLEFRGYKIIWVHKDSYIRFC